MIPFTSLLSFGRNWRVALNDSTWLRPTAYQNMITIVISKSLILSQMSQLTRMEHAQHQTTRHTTRYITGPALAPVPVRADPCLGPLSPGRLRAGRRRTYLRRVSNKETGRAGRSRWGDEERTRSVGTQIAREFYADFCPRLNGQIRLPTATTCRPRGPLTFQISC